MTLIQVLISGAWIEVSLDQIQEGDLFRVVDETRTLGNSSDNSQGSDTFRALSDAVANVDGSVHVTVDKPIQPKFSPSYLDRLRESGIKITVRGSTWATGATGDFRSV